MGDAPMNRWRPGHRLRVSRAAPAAGTQRPAPDRAIGDGALLRRPSQFPGFAGTLNTDDAQRLIQEILHVLTRAGSLRAGVDIERRPGYRLQGVLAGVEPRATGRPRRPTRSARPWTPTPAAMLQRLAAPSTEVARELPAAGAANYAPR